MNKLKTLGASALVLASGAAFAEGNTGVTDAITSFQAQATADITNIGIAMIAVAAVAIGFKWAKAALFS